MRLTRKSDWTGRPILQDRNLGRRVFAREEWMKLIRDTLPPGPLDVLELGCSPGFLGSILFDGTDWRPFGIDYAEDADDYLKSFERIGKQATLHQGDLFEFDVGRTFDAVMSFGLIEHFRGGELDEILALHHRYVRPGGHVVLLVPNFTGYQYFWHYLFDRPSLDTHNVDSMSLATFDAFDALGYRTLFKDYQGQFRVWGNSGWTGTWVGGKAVAALSHLVSRTAGALGAIGLKLTGRSLSPYLLYIGQRPGNDAG